MELTTTLIVIIVITGLGSSVLSLGAKLIYDGIKAKKNGSNSNGKISVNLALLAKDIDFNNKKLAEIENGVNRLIEYVITSNVHLTDLKTATADQTSSFRTLISALTTVIAKLESKL